LKRTTIVTESKKRAAAEARFFYDAVAVCHISSPRPSRTNLPQFVVIYVVIDTDPEARNSWIGGDVFVTDLVGNKQHSAQH
jgi:hypothetical protein